ncbi:integrase [Gluconobacter thailandicus F149-1 = NBRC 100600]|nr:integrase [Gluconobacter thailandicus F149-1 = NBRC 100600]GBR61446.1 integrase [Gluconobacter thailandicus F149-1 = NBRC 100600]GEL87604.1 integrase [Gluconobacter thailandicus F149-1 = NBRC 100600]
MGFGIEMIVVRKHYKYVVEDTDRHGKTRVYLRRPGHRKIRLREAPGTPEFDDEYRRALAGEIAPAQSKSEVLIPGSFRDLCVTYYRSAVFGRLDSRTRYVRRGVLDNLCEKCGSNPVSTLLPKHVMALRDSKAGKPEAGNGILKALRALLAFGVQVGMIEKNPAKEVGYIPASGSGFHSWTPAEIETFEAFYPIGSPARLAFAVLLYTGQRRSDAVRLGIKDIRDGSLTFTQVKNGKRKPVTLTLPVVPDLWRIIEATPGALEGNTFIQGMNGRPYTPESFGNRFRDWCNAAGLPQCSSHGLRKAAAARLAELGCSAHEIAAVTGHRSLKEVQRYTNAADQKRLAKRAFARLVSNEKSHSQHENRRWDGKDRQAIDFEGGSYEMVPKTGIEPVTLRFSVACSTN